MDGERLPLAAKDLGSCDLYPQTLAHNPNGRFVTVCGDGEFIIYTALAWRNKAFGPAEEFVWGEDSSVYATRCGPLTSPPCMLRLQSLLHIESRRPPAVFKSLYLGRCTSRMDGSHSSRLTVGASWDGSVAVSVDSDCPASRARPHGSPRASACREGSTVVKVFKNFKEVSQVKPGYSIEAIYGGALLGIAGADFVAFYDWNSGTVRLLLHAPGFSKQKNPIHARLGCSRACSCLSCSIVRKPPCSLTAFCLQLRPQHSQPPHPHHPRKAAIKSLPHGFTLPQIVRRVDVTVRGVKWSDNGDLVAILSEASFYILAHDREVRRASSLFPQFSYLHVPCLLGPVAVPLRQLPGRACRCRSGSHCRMRPQVRQATHGWQCLLCVTPAGRGGGAGGGRRAGRGWHRGRLRAAQRGCRARPWW